MFMYVCVHLDVREIVYISIIYVHIILYLSRDLASRNVLLSDELVAKVKLVHIPIDDDICYYEVAFPYF